MKKSKLAKINLITFPEKIAIENIEDNKKGYIYCSKQICVEHKYLLQVDFFSLVANRESFRIFFSNDDFTTQILGAERKWSNAQLKFLLNIHLASQANLVPINKRTDKTITSFLKSKVSAYNKGKALDVDSAIGSIFNFQKNVRERALAIKHLKIKNAIDREFTHMDTMPKDMDSWIEKNPLDGKQYIFYRKEKGKYNGYCSACNTELVLPHAVHNGLGICPNCEQPITFKGKGRIKTLQDRFVFSYLQKGIDDKLIMRIYEGQKSYFDGYDRPNVSYFEERRYVYDDIHIQVFHYGNFKNNGEHRWCEGYKSNCFGYVDFNDRGCVYANNLKDVLKSSRYEDCRLEKYALAKHEFILANYLHMFRNYTGLRFLVENQLYSLVNEWLHGYAYDFTMYHEVSQIITEHKSFYPLFRDIGIRSDEVKLLTAFSSKKFIKKEILLWIRENNVARQFLEILQYTTPLKAINYLEKQMNTGQLAKDMVVNWIDYLKFAEELDYDIKSSFIIFPKDLMREHDRLSDEIVVKENQVNNAVIESLSETHNLLFGYEDEKYLIRAPLDAKEIKAEGTELRHCVASYIKDVVEEKAVILFIRDKSDLLKPFYTLEYKDREIRQCMGFKHSKATEDVWEFVDKWENQLSIKESVGAVCAVC